MKSISLSFLWFFLECKIDEEVCLLKQFFFLLYHEKWSKVGHGIYLKYILWFERACAQENY